MGGLVVFRIGAVISDFRSGQNNNLSGIGRVGENFLVASDGSIKNDFAVAFAFGAVAFASKDAAIFEGKDSLHSCSRDWILEILAGISLSSNALAAHFRIISVDNQHPHVYGRWRAALGAT